LGIPKGSRIDTARHIVISTERRGRFGVNWWCTRIRTTGIVIRADGFIGHFYIHFLEKKYIFFATLFSKKCCFGLNLFPKGLYII
jgi:hypothetical protein